MRASCWYSAVFPLRAGTRSRWHDHGDGDRWIVTGAGAAWPYSLMLMDIKHASGLKKNESKGGHRQVGCYVSSWLSVVGIGSVLG
jgi:hypothetical protein